MKKFLDFLSNKPFGDGLTVVEYGVLLMIIAVAVLATVVVLNPPPPRTQIEKKEEGK